VPFEVERVYLDAKEKRQVEKYVVDTDEGPRASTLEALAKLKPVFDAKGSVTAGNSSQTSDGAAFVLVVSERMLKQLNVKPIARLLSYHVAGVAPRIMGIGPVAAVPKAMENGRPEAEGHRADRVERGLRFAELGGDPRAGLDPSIVNVNGGAIAMGHPLGCTGAKLSVQLFNEMRRRKQKYGVVTMCVGTGQGAASVFELLN
jgi:acetyl-CoA acyltransferase